MKRVFVLVSFILAACSSNPARQDARAKSKAPGRAIAQSAPKTPEEAFRGYLGCKERFASATDASWIGCVDPYVVQAESRREDLVRFLMLPIEVKNVSACTIARQNSARGFSGATPVARCFDFVQDGEAATGIVYFYVSGGEHRVFSLTRLRTP